MCNVCVGPAHAFFILLFTSITKVPCVFEDQDLAYDYGHGVSRQKNLDPPPSPRDWPTVFYLR